MPKRMDFDELSRLQKDHPEDSIHSKTPTEPAKPTTGYVRAHQMSDSPPAEPKRFEEPHQMKPKESIQRPIEPIPNVPMEPVAPPDGTVTGGEWKPVEVQQEPERQLYWGVVTTDCCFSYLTPGARAVTRWSGGFKVDGGRALFVDKAGRGSTFSCTPEEFALVEHGIKNFILRPNGMGGADRISTIGKPRTTPEGKTIIKAPYLRQPNDVPLGWFICIVKIANKNSIPEWSNDELEIRRRTYFRRPDDLLNVDIFPPEEQDTTGVLKSQEDAFAAMLPPEEVRPVKFPASPKKRIGNVVIEKA